ncbi:MAG: C25 family cysteine peptidase [Candidatus Cloacimonadales bacterium]
MKKNNQIIAYVLLVLALFANVLKAETRVVVKDSSPQQLQLEVSSSDFVLSERVYPDQQAYSNILPGSGKLLPGQPDLPQSGRWIVVPNGARIDLAWQRSEPVLTENILLAPVQPQRRDQAAAENPPFTLDKQIYSANSFFPEEIVRIERRVIKDNQEYALLKISPYQYNPQTKVLKFYPNLQVQITFQGGDKNIVSNKFASTLNANIIDPQTNNRHLERQSGYEMLIITAAEFAAAAENLANWKKQLGLKTLVLTTDEIGNTAEAIENYIDNSCATWEINPSYLLLLGDAEFIPTHYRNEHPYSDGDQGYTASDLYYADLQDDLLADMAFGRIPIDTVAEADSIVARIIRYEKNPPAQASFYQDAIAAAYFQEQDGGNGIAERRFAKTAEDFRNFLQQQNDYQVERIYVTQNSTDPLYWNDGPYVFENDEAAEPLPLELRRPSFAWDGNYTDIINSVNAGKFMLLHRDHGWRQGWGDPYFDVNNVAQLSNINLPPIVWSINCETGWFDNETDATSCGTSFNSESFTEAWLRHNSAGSVGVFAATRVSYSGNNDRLVWGMLNAIWPEFLSWTGADYPAHAGLHRMGDVLNYGIEYLMANYTWGDDVLLTTIEEFSYFGDPAMRMYTQQPQDIVATHEPIITFGTEEFLVESEAEGALATLVYQNEIISRGYVQSGEVLLELDVLENIGEAVLTISAHNHRPYIAEIFVEPEGAYIKSELSSISEQGDYIDGSWQSLDLLDLNIQISNIGSEDSGELELNLISTDDRVEILQASATSSGLAAGMQNLLESAFSISLLEGIADSTMIGLQIEVDNGEQQWTSQIEFLARAANLVQTNYQLAVDNPNQIFSPGTSGQIYFDLQNIGSGYAYQVNTALSSENELATIVGAESIEQLAPGAIYSSEQAFQISLDADFPIDTYLPLQYIQSDLAELTFVSESSILIGVLLYDFEAVPAWESEALTEGYGNQWHLSSQANVTLDGEQAYKFGSSNADTYHNLQHGALYTPEIQLDSGSFLRFWHKMNVGHQFNEVSWDGGLLEISVDGAEFEQIYPVDGYPNSLLNLPSSPFAADTEFFSGHFDWRQEEFDLSAYSGSAIIRFVFGSANMQTFEGWYLDDLRFGSHLQTASDDFAVEVPDYQARNYPNPFVPGRPGSRQGGTTIEFTLPQPESDAAKVTIFNLKGQVVKNYRLAVEPNRSGTYQVNWSGDDGNGKAVGSGIYFYRVASGRFSSTHKMMIIK